MVVMSPLDGACVGAPSGARVMWKNAGARIARTTDSEEYPIDAVGPEVAPMALPQ